MQTANSFKHLEGWESLVGLWDRANVMRAFLWQQKYEEPKALLYQFLVRLRRFYGIDFSAGGLVDGENLTSAAIPEAGLDHLPEQFARRCLDLVAHARAPISWNEVKAEFGFRSMVVAPIAPPSANPVGFLMLGHSSRRIYSAAELFVLQTLAGELNWVARELARKRTHREEFVTFSHDVKNDLQLIIGNLGFIRENLNGTLTGEQEIFFRAIDSAVERMIAQLNPQPSGFAAEQAPQCETGEPSGSNRDS